MLHVVENWAEYFRSIPHAVFGHRTYQVLIDSICRFDEQLNDVTDEQLLKASLSLRYRARSGESLDDLLPEAFGLVRQASHRAIGMRHYPVQLEGGISLQQGAIAEMQTGEGKTLTATSTLYLAALEGRGAHLATANDYLATRDAELMRPVYERLGMTVGVVDARTPQPQRRTAYQCDITYGTAKEFGFDFLRDRLAIGRAGEGPSHLLEGMLADKQHDTAAGQVQRELHFILVDEADSILIDEARTPLIVSSLPDDAEEKLQLLYSWSAKQVYIFDEQDHYHYDHQRRSISLTPAGRRLVRELNKPDLVEETDLFEIYTKIETALKVNREFTRDRQYIVRDGEVVIVDEFTGRLAEGRKWREGIHQAVEAMEGLEVSLPTGEAARITMQDFFSQYRRGCGMTGTADDARTEFRQVYTMPVRVIPTNRPSMRQYFDDLVFGTSTDKWNAIVDEVREMHLLERPVLIGTRSIDNSEFVSQLLEVAGIPHLVLNARQNAQEADIVSFAGERGRVTVATNMAGRGTDIRIDDDVQPLGGLHVIGTELHESPRVDRQLFGRCGRQGDPGSCRQFISLDDEVFLAALGPQRFEKFKAYGGKNGGPLPHLAGTCRRLQARVARRFYQQRKILLFQERERKKLQRQMGQDPFLDASS
ncbi:MAG: preprotein translocase subunit SecA [Pirellulaceae bacterium]|jgi:preprotein translocase subunit SecA